MSRGLLYLSVTAANAVRLMLLSVRDRFSVVWDYPDRFPLVGLCRESGEIQFLYERGS